MKKYTDKVLLWFLGVIFAGCICCICVLFLFVGGPLSFLKSGGAYSTAKAFIYSSPSVKEEVGNVKSLGIIPQGSVNISNGEGNGELIIKVNGDKATGRIKLILKKERGKEWVVIEAIFMRKSGENIPILLQPPEIH